VSTQAIEHRDLSAKQLQAAQLHVAGWLLKDIAAELSMHRNTLSTWLKLPEFQREVELYRRELRKAFANRLVSELAPKAFDALVDTLKSEPTDPPTHGERNSAALGVLRALGLFEREAGTTQVGPQVAVRVVTGDQAEEVRARLRDEREVIDIEPAGEDA
jgi:hypothetical protein